jgi:GNAT superfamily N-acetyltransferase
LHVIRARREHFASARALPIVSGVTASNSIEVRRATLEDLPGILELARASLDWVGGEEDARFFRWKHLESPFGASPMWIALDGERVVGFRTFMRWRFRRRDGGVVQAVRAVDTATDPAYQGRGIFTRLTLGALDELRHDGIELVFNTPNEKSLPGYLKMGWSIVGRLPVAVMPRRPSSVLTIARAREPASLWSIEVRVGEAAAAVFSDRESIAELLSVRGPSRGLSTAVSPEFLTWRYGYAPLHYRVVARSAKPAEGLVVFRLRRRGAAVEAVLGDVLTPDGERGVARDLIRTVARETGADYVLRLHRPVVSAGPFVRIPRAGPILTCRVLGDATSAPREWDLTLGDVELF